MLRSRTNAQDAPVATLPPEEFRGVNNRTAPENLAPGYVAAAQNVRMRDGEIAPRLGVIKPGWLNATDTSVQTLYPVGEFFGGCVFKDPNGVEWVITIADGTAFRHRPHNNRYELPKPAAVKFLSRCVPVQAFNRIWLFRGRYLAPLVLNDLDDGFEDLLPHWAATTVAAVADEVAYGPFQAATSITSSGGQATVITTVEHGYVTGADITISGALQTEYNGRYNIVVVDAFTFTYAFAGSATTPATGTLTCSNMSDYWEALTAAQALTSITRVGTTATATSTAGAHGYTTGDIVNVTGAAQSQYNGSFTITVTGANTFTYTMTSDPGASASGTLRSHRRPVESVDWQQIYDILPNADDALYINNRLLVPTAYTPGDSTYDSTSSYTKKDFIVATDFLDPLHFDFAEEFRINQGSADEIVTLVKYNNDTVIVLKGASFGILTGITSTGLSALALDMHGDSYGACAPTAVVAGKDVFFPALKRGLVSLRQNELGQTRSVDIPFSDEIEGYVKRINWQLAPLMRLAYWDDKLYWAVPLDGATCDQREVLVLSGGVAGNGSYYEITPTLWRTEGVEQIVYVPSEGVWRLYTDSIFTYVAPSLLGPWAADGGDSYGPPTEAGFQGELSGVNNALLVYDFRVQAWQGVDVGEAICPQEFIKPTYNGLERLVFLSFDGYSNIVEEATMGDQVVGVVQGLTWAEIETDVTSRGIAYDTDAPKQFQRLDVTLAVWNAKFTLTANTGAAFQDQTVREEVEFSRTKYLKPFDKAPYTDGNVNLDFATRGRGNYSVPLSAGGVLLGAGLEVSRAQEVMVRASVRTLAHRYVQFRITNTQGRCAIATIGAQATEGQRRDNLII